MPTTKKSYLETLDRPVLTVLPAERAATIGEVATQMEELESRVRAIEALPILKEGLPTPGGQGPTWKVLADFVAEAYQVPVMALYGRQRRGGRVEEARHIVLYLAVAVFGRSHRVVEAAYNRTHPSALHSVRGVYDRIETEPAFARGMAMLAAQAKQLS